MNGGAGDSEPVGAAASVPAGVVGAVVANAVLAEAARTIAPAMPTNALRRDEERMFTRGDPFQLVVISGPGGGAASSRNLGNGGDDGNGRG